MFSTGSRRRALLGLCHIGRREKSKLVRWSFKQMCGHMHSFSKLWDPCSYQVSAILAQNFPRDIGIYLQLFQTSMPCGKTGSGDKLLSNSI